MHLPAYLDFAVEEILRMGNSHSIQPTDYDTSWVARLSHTDGSLAYPGLLRHVLDRQHEDGSWGSQTPYVHDRLLTTLSVVLLLARFGRRRQDRAQLAAGESYIWQHVERLRLEEHRTVGFEMILPTLLAEGRELGINLPYGQLHNYEHERAKKMHILPREHIFKKQTSALFSLEAFADEVDVEGVTNLLLENGSVATSPSATAFLLNQVLDWRSLYPQSAAYIDNLAIEYGDSGVPTIAPSDIFVRAWTINYMYHGNLLTKHAEALKPSYEYLLSHWRPEGVGWASVGLAESDDTAMVLLALRRAGYDIDGRCLLDYERDQHFTVLPYERDPSVSANLHILEALDTLPEQEQPRVRDKIIKYVFRTRRDGAYWLDKWHVSAYYPTSRALIVLSSLVPEEMAPTVHWLLSTQRADGAWGQHMPTSEETALTLLALLKHHRQERSLSREPLRKAACYLLSNEHPFPESYPELWVSKALYAPKTVIRSVILAALALYCDTFDEQDLL